MFDPNNRPMQPIVPSLSPGGAMSALSAAQSHFPGASFPAQPMQDRFNSTIQALLQAHPMLQRRQAPIVPGAGQTPPPGFASPGAVQSAPVPQQPPMVGTSLTVPGMTAASSPYGLPGY